MCINLCSFSDWFIDRLIYYLSDWFVDSFIPSCLHSFIGVFTYWFEVPAFETIPISLPKTHCSIFPNLHLEPSKCSQCGRILLHLLYIRVNRQISGFPGCQKQMCFLLITHPRRVFLTWQWNNETAAISRHFLQRISLWRWKTIHYLLVLLGTRFTGIEGEVILWEVSPYILYPQISSPRLFPIKHSVQLQVPSRKHNKNTHKKKKNMLILGGVFFSNNTVFTNVPKDPKTVPVDPSGRLWRCYSWGSTAAHDLMSVQIPTLLSSSSFFFSTLISSFFFIYIILYIYIQLILFYVFIYIYGLLLFSFVCFYFSSWSLLVVCLLHV